MSPGRGASRASRSPQYFDAPGLRGLFDAAGSPQRRVAPPRPALRRGCAWRLFARISAAAGLRDAVHPARPSRRRRRRDARAGRLRPGRRPPHRCGPSPAAGPRRPRRSPHAGAAPLSRPEPVPRPRHPARHPIGPSRPHSPGAHAGPPPGAHAEPPLGACPACSACALSAIQSVPSPPHASRAAAGDLQVAAGRRARWA